MQTGHIFSNYGRAVTSFCYLDIFGRRRLFSDQTCTIANDLHNWKIGHFPINIKLPVIIVCSSFTRSQCTRNNHPNLDISMVFLDLINNCNIIIIFGCYYYYRGLFVHVVAERRPSSGREFNQVPVTAEPTKQNKIDRLFFFFKSFSRSIH